MRRTIKAADIDGSMRFAKVLHKKASANQVASSGWILTRVLWWRQEEGGGCVRVTSSERTTFPQILHSFYLWTEVQATQGATTITKSLGGRGRPWPGSGLEHCVSSRDRSFHRKQISVVGSEASTLSPSLLQLYPIQTIRADTM